MLDNHTECPLGIDTIAGSQRCQKCCHHIKTETDSISGEMLTECNIDESINQMANIIRYSEIGNSPEKIAYAIFEKLQEREILKFRDVPTKGN